MHNLNHEYNTTQMNNYCSDKLLLSRHMIVRRAVQEAGAPHLRYIDRKNENDVFTLLYLGDPLSNWNQICYRVARQPGESTYQT